MAILPFKQQKSSKELLATTCHLYKISLLPVIPWSILLVLLYDFILFGETLFNKSKVHLFLQLAMFAAILCLPVLSVIFSVIDNVARESPQHFIQLIVKSLNRFLGLIGTLFSMVLLPAIILGACIAIYFYLEIKGFYIIYTFTWIGVSSLLIFATIVTKIFAPLLTLIDEQEPNDSIDLSEKMTKGYYWRTFIYCLYSILLIVFIADIPRLIDWYLPRALHPSSFIGIGISQLLLVLIAPWSYTFYLVQKYDLQVSQISKKG